MREEVKLSQVSKRIKKYVTSTHSLLINMSYTVGENSDKGQELCET